MNNPILQLVTLLVIASIPAFAAGSRKNEGGKALAEIKPSDKADADNDEKEESGKSSTPVSQSSVGVIFWKGRFYPDRVSAKKHEPLTLYFTNLEAKAVALIVGKLDKQAYLPAAAADKGDITLASRAIELDRELQTNRITEIVIEPDEDIIGFREALSGASGEIVAK